MVECWLSSVNSESPSIGPEEHKNVWLGPHGDLLVGDSSTLLLFLLCFSSRSVSVRSTYEATNFAAFEILLHVGSNTSSSVVCRYPSLLRCPETQQWLPQLGGMKTLGGNDECGISVHFLISTS